MQSLWPSAGFKRSTPLAVWVCVVGLSHALGWCGPDSLPMRLAPLERREQNLHRVPAHISDFSPVSEPMALSKCGNVRPPEALLTPDPLPQLNDDDLDVRVSFIVGADGHVHSAFVLESGGAREDRVVLHTISTWRYRPALCNGVPTDSEARVRFSIR